MCLFVDYLAGLLIAFEGSRTTTRSTSVPPSDKKERTGPSHPTYAYRDPSPPLYDVLGARVPEKSRRLRGHSSASRDRSLRQSKLVHHLLSMPLTILQQIAETIVRLVSFLKRDEGEETKNDGSAGDVDVHMAEDDEDNEIVEI